MIAIEGLAKERGPHLESLHELGLGHPFLEAETRDDLTDILRVRSDIQRRKPIGFELTCFDVHGSILHRERERVQRI